MGLFGKKTKARNKRRAKRPSRIAALLNDLHDPDESTLPNLQEKLHELHEYGLTEQEVNQMLQAAVRHADLRTEQCDLCTMLIAYSFPYAQTYHLDYVVEQYEELSPQAQFVIPKMIMSLPFTTDRVEFLAAVILMNPQKSILSFADLSFISLADDPELAALLLTRLAYLIRSLEWAHHLYELAVHLVEEGLMDSDTYDSLFPHMMDHYVEMTEELTQVMQQPRWEFSERGIYIRKYLYHATNFICHGSNEFSAAVFMSEAKSPIIKIKAGIICQMLRSQLPVPADVIRELAEHPESRNRICGQLMLLEQLELFPQEYFTNEHLGESALVNWLSDFDQMMNAPDEIEFMSAIDLKEYGTCLVYRFRYHAPHDMEVRGWMAGFVGPVDLDDPMPAGGPMLGSLYEPWDHGSAEDHFVMMSEHLIEQSEENEE